MLLKLTSLNAAQRDLQGFTALELTVSSYTYAYRTPTPSPRHRGVPM